MTSQRFHKAIIGLVFAVSVFAIPAVASADCLTANLNGLPADAGRSFKMTIILDSGSWVSWSSGVTNDLGTASFNMTQLFSDRFNGSQPFNVGAADSHVITSISSSTGAVSIHNNTWNFNWGFNLSCVGGSSNMAMATISGAVIIISFGGLVPIVG